MKIDVAVGGILVDEGVVFVDFGGLGDLALLPNTFAQDSGHSAEVPVRGSTAICLLSSPEGIPDRIVRGRGFYDALAGDLTFGLHGLPSS